MVGLAESSRFIQKDVQVRASLQRARSLRDVLPSAMVVPRDSDGVGHEFDESLDVIPVFRSELMGEIRLSSVRNMACRVMEGAVAVGATLEDLYLLVLRDTVKR